MRVDNDRLVWLVERKDDEALIKLKVRGLKRLSGLKSAIMKEEFYLRNINYARELIAKKNQIPLAFTTTEIKVVGDKKRGRPKKS